MFDGTAVKALQDSLNRPLVLQVGNEPRLVVPHGWSEGAKPQASVAAITVNSLTSFVDYCKHNVDDLPLSDCIAHVTDPGTVVLRAKLEAEAESFRRKSYVVATTNQMGSPPFAFGAFVPAEMFFIGLQAGFVATPDREALLTLIASIRENSVRETVDTGVAQEVKASKGIVLLETARVPNPNALRPFRTFREIEQPESLFILRLQQAAQGDKPTCALFEADGGAWKLAAMQSIGEYLKHHLTGTDVAVIA